MKLKILLAVLLVFLVAFFAVKNSQKPEPLKVDEIKKVFLSLDWIPNTNHTGFYVALHKGWYQENGLEVNIQIPSDPAASLKQVASGQTEFGISYQEEVTLARDQNIPIVSIAAIIQHNSSAFAWLDPKIKGPKDWENKKYASFGLPLEKAVLQGLMDCQKANFEKIEFVDTGFEALKPLFTNQADFAWIFPAWDGVKAQLEGKPLKTFPLYPSCVPDYYTPVLATGESTIKTNPEMIKKFLQATSRGFEFAINNPTESAQILANYTPETPRELLQKSQEILSPKYQDDASFWGEQKLSVWENFGRWLEENQLIKNFDAPAAFTNEFLPEN